MKKNARNIKKASRPRDLDPDLGDEVVIGRVETRKLAHRRVEERGVEQIYFNHPDVDFTARVQEAFGNVEIFVIMDRPAEEWRWWIAPAPHPDPASIAPLGPEWQELGMIDDTAGDVYNSFRASDSGVASHVGAPLAWDDMGWITDYEGKSGKDPAVTSWGDIIEPHTLSFTLAEPVAWDVILLAMGYDPQTLEPILGSKAEPEPGPWIDGDIVVRDEPYPRTWFRHDGTWRGTHVRGDFSGATDEEIDWLVEGDHTSGAFYRAVKRSGTLQ